MIDHLDHLVLTTANETACVDFYTRIMGMSLESFVGGTPPVTRKAFKYGNQKINLHVKGKEFDPKAHLPVPDSKQTPEGLRTWLQSEIGKWGPVIRSAGVYAD